MDIQNLIQDATPFLQWCGQWHDELPTWGLAAEVSDPASVAVLSVDVINGFCYAGPLSSPRVAAIVPPIVSLLERAHALGVPHLLLTQDTHDEDAVEFGSFAPHAIRGSVESETVDEFKALPFFEQFTVIPKNSISSSLDTQLPAWLEADPELNTFIVVGDCTDLCVYQLALYLRLRANVQQRAADRVILPANCVQTFDLPVSTAQEYGIMPHHGDLSHLLFLYHMALNGVQVVANIV